MQKVFESKISRWLYYIASIDFCNGIEPEKVGSKLLLENN
jgi:hypothetical protein